MPSQSAQGNTPSYSPAQSNEVSALSARVRLVPGLFCSVIAGLDGALLFLGSLSFCFERAVKVDEIATAIAVVDINFFIVLILWIYLLANYIKSSLYR